MKLNEGRGLVQYCAFLRGVNVNGTTMKMNKVCDVFRQCGVFDVSFVLASGNIIFSSAMSPKELQIKLEQAMSLAFNYSAYMFIRSKADIQEMSYSIPFQEQADSHIYVFVCDKGFEQVLESEFAATGRAEGEEGILVDSYFFWKVLKGSTLTSEFSKILGKKTHKGSFTSRNMNTIRKVLVKFGE